MGAPPAVQATCPRVSQRGWPEGLRSRWVRVCVSDAAGGAAGPLLGGTLLPYAGPAKMWGRPTASPGPKTLGPFCFWGQWPRQRWTGGWAWQRDTFWGTGPAPRPRPRAPQSPRAQPIGLPFSCRSPNRRSQVSPHVPAGSHALLSLWRPSPPKPAAADPRQESQRVRGSTRVHWIWPAPRPLPLSKGPISSHTCTGNRRSNMRQGHQGLGKPTAPQPVGLPQLTLRQARALRAGASLLVRSAEHVQSMWWRAPPLHAQAGGGCHAAGPCCGAGPQLASRRM